MWAPAVFKEKDRVWAEVDAAGALVVRGGRVAIRYKDDEAAKSYSATAGNVRVDGAPVAPPPVSGIVVWTDGACSGNPGPAGSGVVVELVDRKVERHLALGHATNNVGELTAVRMALTMLDELGVSRDSAVTVHTDSKYAIGVLVSGWKAKANVELITELKAELRGWSGVRLKWVEGHAGVPGNERADALARRGVEESRRRR